MRRVQAWRSILRWIALAGPVAVPLPAQVAGCEPIWQVANSLPGTAHDPLSSQMGWLNDVVGWDPDGPGPLGEHIVVCGTPGTVGTISHWGVAMFDPSTSTWSLLSPTAPWTNSWAAIDLAVGPGGELYVATSREVYRWQAGTWVLLSSFPTIPLVSAVSAIEVATNGDLYLSGKFNSVGGVAASNLARFDGVAWHPIGPGPNLEFTSLRRRSNGGMFVFRGYQPAGGASSNDLAVWDGSSWTAIQHPFSAIGTIVDTPAGDVYATGDVGGQPALLRWNGTTWSAVDPAMHEALWDLTTLPNGDLVVSGYYFQSIGGIAAGYVARWDGSAWQSLAGGMDFGGVMRLSLMANGDLLAIGGFRTAGGKAACGVARWHGNDWQPLGSGLNGEIRRLRRLHSGDLLAAGDFLGLETAAGPANRIARRDAVGWHAYGPGFDGEVRDVIELANGDLVAVGLFLHSGGVAMSNVARWNGTTWLPIGNAGPDGTVNAVVQMANGDLVIGGYFVYADGVAVHSVARWDGSAWSTMGSGCNGGIESLVLLPNGDVVVGGGFTVAGGVATTGAARWHGSSWQSMSIGTGAVYALHVATDGGLFASTNADLLQWNGAGWLSLGPNPWSTGIRAFASLPGGQLLTASSQFVLGPTSSTSNLLRWTPGMPGSDTSFASPVGGQVYSMLAEPDGDLLLGGNFFQTDMQYGNPSRPSPYLACLLPTCRATAATYGSGCVGPAGAVLLSSQDLPWLGGTSRTTATGMPPLSIALELLSFQAGIFQLPWAFSPNCFLRTASPLITPMLPNAGTATSTIAIPSTPTIVGLTFYQQVVVLQLDPSGGILSTAGSNGLTLTIGAL